MREQGLPTLILRELALKRSNGEIWLGTNSDGFQNEEPISLRIVIHPPWRATTWAYGFYILFFGGNILTTWKLQLRRIKLRHDLKKREFEADQLKKVDHLKSRFFANSSHEFRTPITLIKGPFENFSPLSKIKRRTKNCPLCGAMPTD